VTGTHSRTLVVARHARAAGGLGLTDARRPLTERGRRDAEAAGRELAALGAVPDLVLCSPARRTRETWSAMSGRLGGRSEAAPRVEENPRIYDADVESLVDVIREVDAYREVVDPVGGVLLMGHNPAVHDLVLALTGWSDPRTGFVPGAFAVIRVPVDWPDIGPGTGDLATVWAPETIP
jgi:phosphohistidine phosphatase